MEPGETPEEALKREIWEELETKIVVERLVQTVEYDYPKFHLTMHCFWCRVDSGSLTLKEHEAARWLTNKIYQHKKPPPQKTFVNSCLQSFAVLCILLLLLIVNLG
jgi:mutator protein MutT